LPRPANDCRLRLSYLGAADQDVRPAKQHRLAAERLHPVGNALVQVLANEAGPQGQFKKGSAYADRILARKAQEAALTLG
jgi:hypothetical protein